MKPHRGLNYPPGIRQVHTRPGSKRFDLLELLEEPTHLSIVEAKFGLTEQEARRAIRELHRFCGWGVREDSEGNVVVYA